jgi:hypothetical protein
MMMMMMMMIIIIIPVAYIIVFARILYSCRALLSSAAFSRPCSSEIACNGFLNIGPSGDVDSNRSSISGPR